MPPEYETGSKPGILNLELTAKEALYSAYMPFVENGGIFVPMRDSSIRQYGLGDEVLLLLRLRLEDVDERLPTPGRVAWITPGGAQGQRKPGIGIQFAAKDRGTTQQRIEAILAGSVTSNRPTNTL